MVTAAIKLLQELRFTYWPRDLRQASRGEKDLYSLIRVGD